MSDRTSKHGFTAVPRSLNKLVADRSIKARSVPVTVDDIGLPNTPLVTTIQAYAKQNLPIQAYNHSMRVYYYGRAIASQHFPTWQCSSETLLLAALLHDIGATPANQTSTYLSFEFFGGIFALDLLKSHHAEIAQAESVCETIIRHQDLGETGSITTLTAIVHFATVLDNAGLHEESVAKETIKDVVRAFPRDGWTGCFASVVRKECQTKPWANTTRIDGFAEMVEANNLMRPYDD